MSFTASASLAVLMNSVNRPIASLFPSIVIALPSTHSFRGLAQLSGRLRRHVELEQAGRIAPADLEPVILAEAGAVEPVGRMVDILERPVDREQDAVGADFEDGIDQRLGAEIPRRG